MEDALQKLAELHAAALAALEAASKYAREHGLEYYYSRPDSETDWEASEEEWSSSGCEWATSNC